MPSPSLLSRAAVARGNALLFPLMEQMMADANVARDKKLAAKKTEEKRMKKQFGDGLKSNLKKGFLSGSSKKSSKKAPKEESAPEVIETLRPQRGKSKPGERESAMKQEVAEAMAASEHPIAQSLKGGQWITPDLTEKIASNEKLTRAMADPRFDVALKTMAKDPKRAMAMLDSEPWLKEAFVELCGQMGGHFSAMGEQQQPVERRPHRARRLVHGEHDGAPLARGDVAQPVLQLELLALLDGLLAAGRAPVVELLHQRQRVLRGLAQLVRVRALLELVAPPQRALEQAAAASSSVPLSICAGSLPASLPMALPMSARMASKPRRLN